MVSYTQHGGQSISVGVVTQFDACAALSALCVFTWRTLRLRGFYRKVNEVKTQRAQRNSSKEWSPHVQGFKAEIRGTNTTGVEPGHGGVLNHECVAYDTSQINLRYLAEILAFPNLVMQLPKCSADPVGGVVDGSQGDSVE